ncbi:N-acetylmuramoyl-L-alanine amidase [Moritella viscosa]|uniref:N-acetylmuramoyl-L-alanine amidase n=1 Tax=Moritella viscosa TaxID=80854 RepID=A0ABY1HI87_9GAMM|nr:N-acetylmuramoyl-L-alanine amidase [Moritella viscosa]CED61072.1 N-acetylmuramoyl-L-alanine amidase [Moritella viscosa]SGY95053.1 N-acetylmuramoyl-L-alanine amidase AmiD [Moritella viscosa]SGZ00287.1 N-acetylmuramoyl-L-alanine amidase AmiD [Moritella viscosa]SGZ00709.1 N-acetylmuramoyl-L-alanine amidase AmiD [Moritella viscosa]SGZ06928.1 N-acetylmuramoyl-L-alanine amidase AmiD [Moritella viscosa]
MLIDYNSYRATKSFNRRVRFVVLHYTAANFSASVKSLTGDSVSSHYLIPDKTDKTYCNAGFSDMRVFNLVDEAERAWHAGKSSWMGRSNLNDTSIGIEIVNQASYSNGKFIFPQYSTDQIEAVKSLLKNILQRYPDIDPTHIVGHSDIAPGRKSDPGSSFPWKDLYEEGIGAWYDKETVDRYLGEYTYKLPNQDKIISMLKVYGYDTSVISSEKEFRNIVRAFQLHFRPEDCRGNIDTETASILSALVEKYRM